MRRRLSLGVVIATLCACVAYAVWFQDNRPQLVRAPDALTRHTIRVGKSVHVSAALPHVHHEGCTLAADPTDADRLFAASMHLPRPGESGIAGYASNDGGATWALATQRLPGPGERCCDETVAYSPYGGVYLAHMRGPAEGGKPTVFAYSPDNGKTWEERGATGQIADRPQIVIDASPGPRRGRLYCNANDNRPLFFASEDGGRTIESASLPDARFPTVYPSNPVVLADGTVVIAYRRSGGTNALAPPAIAVWRSTDGGKTFSAATHVPTAWRHARARSNSGLASYPLLAAGPPRPGAQPAGRLYCVWTDGARRDERCVLISSSDDRGATWQPPLVLSDQPLGADAAADWQADIPAVAVNKHGVVAVCWYDRRGLPKSTTSGSGAVTSARYNIRLRVSIDGGDTWLPSVQVNEQPGKGDLFEVRFWSGLGADTDGRFHPLWIGDATGTGQLWTATVEVKE
jgi:hypothetical protein